MRACWDPALRKLGLLGWEPEKGAEVLQRHRAGLFRCKLAQSGKVTRGLHHERRLVALAAMRNRRQVGAVGLQKETVERHHFSGLADVLRLGIAEISGEGE